MNWSGSVAASIPTGISVPGYRAARGYSGKSVDRTMPTRQKSHYFNVADASPQRRRRQTSTSQTPDLNLADAGLRDAERAFQIVAAPFLQGHQVAEEAVVL